MCAYVLGLLAYPHHLPFLLIFLCLLNTDLLYSMMDLANHISFISQLNQLFTVPVYGIFIFNFFLTYYFKISVSLIVFCILPIHSLVNPASLTLNLLNPLLINSLNLVHPFLVNFFLFFNFLVLIIMAFKFLNLAFFYEQVRNLVGCVFLLSIIFFTSLFLGSFWALQMTTWGGWWVWDLSETVLIFFYIPVLLSAHLIFTNREFSKFFLLTNFLFFLYFFITKLALNSLEPTLHTFFLNPLNLVNLIFFKFFFTFCCSFFSWGRLIFLTPNFTAIKLNFLVIDFLLIWAVLTFLFLMPLLRSVFFTLQISFCAVTRLFILSSRRSIWLVHIILFFLIYYFLFLGVYDLNFCESYSYTLLSQIPFNLSISDSSFIILLTTEGPYENYLKLFVPEFTAALLFLIDSTIYTHVNLNFFQKVVGFFFENIF